MNRLPATALLLSLLVGAAAANHPVGVQLDEASLAVREGEPFRFVSTISNTGNASWPEVTATLNVVRLGDGQSEDPEDWDPSWSHRFVLVQPGASVPVEWEIRTIKGGDFLFFVTAVVHGDDADGPWAHQVVSSGNLLVTIEAAPVIPSARLIPIAVGVPLVVAAILATRIRSQVKS